MQIKPKIGILTTFGGSDSAYSLVNVVSTQLQMLIDGGYYPVLFVCPSFTGTGVWADNHIETRRTIQSDKKADEIVPILRDMIKDIDVMICHDITFLAQHVEWAQAVRLLAPEFPNIRWLHWQHSRGDHSPIEPVENSEFCYPNQGDLPHVAGINSTTIDRVHYVPHPLDFAYLGWPELAIRIAEDFNFPFVDVSMIYPTRLDRQKQVERAMRVFSGLKKAGKSICLLVADAYATGDRFKDYKKDCMKLAEELEFTDKEFAFLGEVYEECTVATPRPVVKALFEMSNIFLQVSTSETSSLVVMEAALAGNLIVLNADFPPIHHLYGKSLTIPFGSVFEPNIKYYRHIRTADGAEVKVEDPQLFFDEQARNLILPILGGQLTEGVKKQQFRDRWPSRVFKDYLEPLLLKDWKPKEVIPACTGDPEVTAIICTLDNIEILKRQIPVLMKEVGHIIVVSNGSKDGTNEWLEENPIKGLAKIYLDVNSGAGIGRNAGLELWDRYPTPYTLMVDGGILPPYNGVKPMKDYLLRHPDVSIVSPEIASCYTTDESLATLVFNKEIIDDENTFLQRSLSGTAYCLCKADAWSVRFSEEGPYGEPGWGVDDNDMQYRWNEMGIKHADFVQTEGMVLFRRASGSFQRLYEDSGVWPNQYGSVYEKRLVKLNQDYPQYQGIPPEVSCVVLGWNEYPNVVKVIKSLHDEFNGKADYEIIFIDNGSTDETKKWTDMQRYRQHWGDTTIDTETGEIIKRSPENEELWTGNFMLHRFDENVGAGAGKNKGFEMARGKYIFYIDGDITIVPGSVMGLKKFLDENPDAMYAGLNAWLSESDLTKELPEFTEIGPPYNLGNYAYSYAMVRRETWDNGCKFADQGPFEGAGAGYEEIEFAYQMYNKGYKAYVFNGLAYYHQRRDGTRSGIVTKMGGGIDERKKYLQTKWVNTSFDITYHSEMPPDKHIRKIAMMNNNVWYPNNPGPAGFLTMALRKIGCEVDQFASLDIPPDKEKYDDFIFVDDGDLQHWQCPEWAHPSKYWAVDMYNPSCFPYAPPEEYLKKASSFDEFYSISQSAVEFCIQNGVQAYHLPHAGNEDYHKPYPESKIWDWLCIWHNYNERADYSKAALEKFPNGFLSDDTWGDDYPIYTSRARCVINKVRGFEYNAKVVETMMIGVPLVTDRAKYLDTFFVENEHFRGHSSIEEMLEQVRWVLDHPTEASDMSERARLLVLKSHRYYHRALRMLSGW